MFSNLGSNNSALLHKAFAKSIGLTWRNNMKQSPVSNGFMMKNPVEKNIL